MKTKINFPVSLVWQSVAKGNTSHLLFSYYFVFSSNFYCTGKDEDALVAGKAVVKRKRIAGQSFVLF